MARDEDVGEPLVELTRSPGAARASLAGGSCSAPMENPARLLAICPLQRAPGNRADQSLRLAPATNPSGPRSALHHWPLAIRHDRTASFAGPRSAIHLSEQLRLLRSAPFPVDRGAAARRIPSAGALRRPMDDLPLKAHGPQEDEFALLGLGAVLPMRHWLFPLAACSWPANSTARRTTRAWLVAGAARWIGWFG